MVRAFPKEGRKQKQNENIFGNKKKKALNPTPSPKGLPSTCRVDRDDGALGHDLGLEVGVLAEDLQPPKFTWKLGGAE